MSADDDSQTPSPEELKLQKTKQLLTVVCICKGINLGRILKVIDSCETVADMNQKAGTGTGGCAGERCGPRIKILLRKNQEAKKKS